MRFSYTNLLHVAKLCSAVILNLGILLFAVPVASFATELLKGRVIDEQDRVPLSGVTVYITELQEDQYTNDFGVFEIRLEPGKYRMVLIYPGYQRLVTVVNVFSGATNEVDFKMKPDDEYVPTEALIQADRIKTSISRTTMTKETMESIPAGAGDIIRQFLGSIPGVAIPGGGWGVAAFVVRGGEPEDNVIYFDNVEIGNIFHFGGLVSIFNAASVQHIDFYAGGFPPGFGHAIGSVMDIKSTRKAKKKFSGITNISMISADAFFEGPIAKKGYFMLSARRSYFDLIMPKVTPIKFQIFPFYWDIFGKFSFDPNKDNLMDLFFLTSYDTFKFNLSAAITDNDLLVGSLAFDYTFFVVGYNWKYVANKWWFNEMTLSWSWYQNTFTGGRLPGSSSSMKYEENDYVVNVKDTVNVLLNENLELSFGPKMQLYMVPIKFNSVIPRVVKNDYDSGGDTMGPTKKYNDFLYWISVNPFAMLTWTIGNFKWYMGPDFYYSQAKESSEDKFMTISPRTGFEWSFFPTWKLLGSWGIYYQQPQGIESFQNNELKDEQSNHYILGVSKNLTKTTQVKLEGYFKHSQNLVEFDHLEIMRDPLTNEISDVKNIYTNTSRGYAYGAELFLQQDLWNGFYGWVSYTLSQSKFKGAKDNDYHLSPYDQTHMLSLIASYAPLKWLQVSAKWHIASGQPLTSIVGRIRTSPQTDYEASYMPVYNNTPYNDRLPYQHQLDVRVDFKFPFFYGKMKLYVEVINAYYAKNVMFLSYGKDYGRYDDPEPISFLPVLPYLGLEYEF